MTGGGTTHFIFPIQIDTDPSARFVWDEEGAWFKYVSYWRKISHDVFRTTDGDGVFIAITPQTVLFPSTGRWPTAAAPRDGINREPGIPDSYEITPRSAPFPHTSGTVSVRRT